MAITQDDFNKIWASTSSVPEYTFSDTDYKNGWEFVGNLPPTRAMWDELQRKNDEKMQFLQENGSMCFDSVADMKSSNLDAGQTAFTKGYHSINDGGSAVYTIRTKTQSDADDGGSIIFLDNDNVAELLVSDNTINVKQFGAKGDNDTDDYNALQNALNAVPNGGCVYFTKGRYKIGTGLVLNKNDVTIYSDFRAEYLCTIYSASSIKILTVTGYGARIQGINFRGNGSLEVFGTTHAITFDRRSLGDAEIYSNIDAEVRDCGFIYIDTCITGYGRNVFVFDCIFSNSKIGVKGQSFIYGNNQYADLRGWRITGNRFHSMGNPIKAMETPPQELDSWCINFPSDDPAMSHVEIANNNADFCYSGFYSGALIGVMMHNNYIYKINAPFIVSENATNIQANMASLYQSVQNNTVLFNTVDGKRFAYAKNLITVKYGREIIFKGNILKNAPRETYVLDAPEKIIIEGEIITNNNFDYLDDNIKRSAISVTAGNVIVVRNLFIRSQNGNTTNYVVSAPTTNEVYFKDNFVLSVDNGVQLQSYASLAKNLIGEGMPWVIPTFQNGWSRVGGMGYRRRFDGLVEINLTLNPGEDNKVVFTLPVGCRPASTFYLTATMSHPLSTENEHYVAIQADGNVFVNYMNNVGTEPLSINVIFEAGA